jgi:hypothetical protein
MDHTENTLRGVVKALTDVIGPAIDPSDALAKEQLRLVVDYLEFVRERLDALYGRERFELSHHLEMARTLHALEPACSPQAREKLTAALRDGNDVRARPGAGVPALKSATAALASAIRSLVREAATFDEPVRRRIERAVIDATEGRVKFDRAWYLPLGFEPAPSEVLPLSDLLAQTEKGA